MTPITLTPVEAMRLTGGRWIGDPAAVTVRGAAVDSRQAGSGCLFVCIRGERVDGHDFAASAAASGAALVLATRPLALPVPVLVVADATRAFLALAGELRRRRDDATWIAVCGANGKTTTKELIAAACGGDGAVVHATAGNHNNHLGVPLTLFATPADAVRCVIEVGTNAPGEVADLAAVVRPDHAVVTSIGPEHLEGFGDVFGVAREECAVFSAIPSTGSAILGLHGVHQHTDAQGVATIRGIAVAAAGGRRLLTYGEGSDPGVVGSSGIRLDTADGSAAIPLLGAHNLANAALAYAAARAAGVAAEAALSGLSRMRPVAGRLVPRPCGPHLVLDDTYNANPASMIAGLRTLAACPGPKLAILGPMGELGATLAEGHRAVGAEARTLGIPLLVVAGRGGLAGAEVHLAAGYGPAAVGCADAAAAVAEARRLIAALPTTVLVKASRSQGLERVVEGLLGAWGVSVQGASCSH